MRFVSKLDWEGVAGLLLEFAKKVARAGVDFAVCPANMLLDSTRLLAKAALEEALREI